MKQSMQQFHVNRMRFVAGVFGLFAILAPACAGFAQQAGSVERGKRSVAAPSTGTVAPAATSQTAKRADEINNQGIKVHGHWVLEVKGKNGKVVERREFDNSLVPGGALLGGDQTLAALLSGNASAGDPAIAFVPAAPTGTDPSTYCNSQTSNATCYVFSTSQNTILQALFTNIETGLSTSFITKPKGQWILSGNYSVPSGLNSIALVQTILQFCINTGSLNTFYSTTPLNGRTANLSPNVCVSGAAGLTTSGGVEDYDQTSTLTSTAVPGGPLTVVPGQIVTVTVTLSFS